MEVAGQIAAKTESLGNDGACMQCDPATNVSRTCEPSRSVLGVGIGIGIGIGIINFLAFVFFLFLF